MAFTIITSNEAGELERISAKDGREAAQKLADMVEGMELADRDTFTIQDDDEQA